MTKYMIIETPDTCMKCHFRGVFNRSMCHRFNRQLDLGDLVKDLRPAWCVEKDVDFETSIKDPEDLW